MSLRKYQMTKPEELPEFRDPEIHEPGETYLSTKIMDRCINCETTQKIIGKIIGRKVDLSVLSVSKLIRNKL